MKCFLRCPKIDRIMTYTQHCAFECPNGINVIPFAGGSIYETGKPLIVKCYVNGKDYSITTISIDEEEKLTNL